MDLAEEMTDICVDLTDRVNELSRNYWKLVKALATVEKERDELHKELKVEKMISKSKTDDCKVIFEIGREKIQEEPEIQDKLYKERDQAEYDRDYYRNENERLRNELEASL